jgi:hypothetical protein
VYTLSQTTGEVGAPFCLSPLAFVLALHEADKYQDMIQKLGSKLF